MDYEMFALSPALIFVRWYHTPALGSDTQKQFIAELQARLDRATVKLHFLSDLRRGWIDDLESLHELAMLSNHPNWGVGISFSTNRTTIIMANTFGRLVAQTEHTDAIFETPEKAIAHLESLQPGLTQGIDWDQWL